MFEAYYLIDTIAKHPLLSVFTSLFSLFFCLMTSKMFSWYEKRLSNKLIIERAQAKRIMQLNNLRKRLADNSLENSNSMISSLHNEKSSSIVTNIKNNKYNTQQVLRYFQQKALEAHDDTNCLTSIIEEAEEFCSNLKLLKDDVHNSDSKLLYGLPVCIKEDLTVKGYPESYGCASRVEILATGDSVIVEALKHHGAIPFVITNLPQTSLSYNCSNPIYGITKNPFDKKRTPGGSSGGNSALIAKGGCTLGIGSDIAGSVRIPAHFCGIVGFKPTVGRLSMKNTSEFLPGTELLVPCNYGPMAKDVDSIILALKALQNSFVFEKDKLMMPLKFDNSIVLSKKKLNIGYFKYNGIFHIAPAIERALEKVKNVLSKNGHNLINCENLYQEIDFGVTTTIISECLNADNAHGILEFLKSEQLDSCISNWIRFMKLPNFLKRMIIFIGKYFDSEFGKGLCIGGDKLSYFGKNSITEYYQVVHKKNLFTEKFLNLWESKNLDIIICPPSSIYSVPLENYDNILNVAGSYCYIWNILNFPAGVVPVTYVSKEDDDNLETYLTLNKQSSIHISAYNALKNGIGLPVGIQVISLQNHDELCLNVMKQIELGLKILDA